MSLEVSVPSSVTGAVKPEEKKEEARPAWLPEKFKTPDDMAKAYAEAEKKITELSAKKTEATKTPAEAGAKAAVDFTAVAKEFETAGQISPETKASLEKAGIPQAVVDQYLTGLKASIEVFNTKAYAAAGGEEEYKNMIQWAGQSLPAEDKAAFDKIVTNGTQDEVLFAIKSLNSQYKAANKSGAVRLVKGSTSNPGSSGGYENMAQFMADVNDPRYKSDPAFRMKAEAKLKASPGLLKTRRS